MVQPITEPESQPGELHRRESLTGAEGETRLMFVFFPRMGNTPDSASDNLGFRCAANQGQKQEKKKDKIEL